MLIEALLNGLHFNKPHLNPDDPNCTANEFFKEISYMVDLSDKIRLWSVCFNILVYTLDESAGEEAEYTYIIDFQKNNHTVKVHNFGISDDIKYLSFIHEKLFAASQYQIYVCTIPSSNFDNDQTTLSVEDMKLRTITPGLKIHGLFLTHWSQKQDFQAVVFENKENFLDFNMLTIDNINDDEKFDYKLFQYREVMARKPGYTSDPLTKVRVYFSDGWCYAVALKESGHFELYWNFIWQEQPEDKFAIDVEMTTDAFYFRLTDGKNYMFNHCETNSISFNQALLISDYDFQWEDIKIKQIQTYVHLYTGFKLSTLNSGSKQQSFVSLSHGKFISIFNITDWKWINHIEFEDDIMCQFLQKQANGVITTSCLTKKGWIYNDFMLDQGNYQDVVTQSMADIFTDGEFIMAADDLENKNYMFTLTKDSNNKKHLSMLYQGNLVKYDNFITDQERCSVVCVKTKGSHYFIVVQNGTKIQVLQCLKYNDINQPVQMKVSPEFNDITGKIHSACTYDIEKYLFLFDERKMYVIEWNSEKQSTCTTYNDLYCIGLNHFTPQYNYALCQDTPKGKCSGLRLFDMESIISRKKDTMLLLKTIDAGTQGYFDYSSNLDRFCFLKSFTHLAIIPQLHRNMNKFMGMADTSTYICYKIFMDKMMALTQDGMLFTWELSTGKMIQSVKLEDHDYSEYIVHSYKKCSMALLKSKELLSDVNDYDYFQPYQFEQSMDKQTVFLKQGGYNYRKWKWIEIINENTVKVLMEYVHPSYNSYHQVYLNKDKDRMIQIMQNYNTFIFRKVIPDSKNPQIIKWEFIKRIEDFPQELLKIQENLQFFSPCFSRYLVCDHKEKQFIVKDLYLGKKITTIPKEIMTFEKKDLCHTPIHRFKWLDSGTFIIVNEEGIEKLIDIDNDFKELAYNMRPLFTQQTNGGLPEWRNNQYYFKRQKLEVSDTLQSLTRCYQDYKTSYYLFKKRSMSQLYQDLISVDQHQFNYSVMSFSFLHWSLIEQIASGKISISDLEAPVVEQIIYNILPGGNTVLHKLADMEKELIKVFMISHPDLSCDEQSIHIPFLPNLKGETAIHMCIKKQDYKSIDTILKYLKYYPTDHHSRGINDLYGELIEKELPEFLPYLDSRFQQTEQMKQITKGCLKDGSNGIIPCELWYKEDNLQGKLMQKKPIETRIKCEILDLPGVYHYQEKEFQQMFDALAQTTKIEFFNLRSVQTLVEFNYSLVRKYVVIYLFIPFCIFQCSFFYFMNFVYEDMENSLSQILFYPLLVINLVFATYFVVNEVRQLVEEGMDYFKSFWNYIDLIPPIGIYTIAIIIILKSFNFEFDITVERSILAIVTFFMWMKFLYFLRIFKNTGYLIRMISEVIVDMRHFFLVLLICIAAFGDSLLTLSYGNPDGEDRFILGFLDSLIYTYRMILGDFDTGAFGQVAQPLVMGIFLLCTVFNMIVMLNLLIAIISDSYARVTSLSEQATYQERSSMIAENNYLIPDSVKQQYAEKNKYLMIVTDLEAELDEVKDPIIEEIHLLKEYLNKQNIQDQKSIVEVSQAQHKMLQADILQLKRFILSTIPRISYKISLHDKPVYQTTFEYLRLKYPESYIDGWFCDGKEIYSGCKDQENPTGCHPDEPEIEHYHCRECKFDFCQFCFDHYGPSFHNHPLEKESMSKIQEFHGPNSYQKGWWCDGRQIKSPYCKQIGREEDPFSIVYHCDVDGVDFCESCYEKFRV